MEHEAAMREALRLAQNAASMDEVPVGALILRDGARLGEGWNCNIEACDPTAHAEVQALRNACAYVDNYRLGASTMYVTLEPCLMCFTAMIHARVTTLVYGASDPKTGFTRFLEEEQLGLFNHQMEIVSGVLESECSQTITDFFRQKRERGKRKWMRQKG